MRILHYFVALCVFVVITVLLSRPLITNLNGLSSNGGEEYLLSYIISWVRYIVPKDVSRIFDPPFLYPTPNTLAFSDYYLSQGLISMPLYAITHNPMATYNLLVVLALILNPFSFYILAHKLTQNSLASLITAVIFGFSVGRLDLIGHLQVFAMYWVLLGLAALVQYFETKQWRWAWLLALLFLAQGADTVFMMFVFAVALLCTAVAYQIKVGLTIHNWAKLLAPGVIVSAILAALYLPYLQVAKTYSYTRTLQDIYAGSAYWADYLYPTHNSNLRPLAEALIFKQPWTAYMGFSITVLAALSLLFFWKRKKDWRVLTTLGMFTSGLILSFGPYFQIIRQRTLLGIPLPLPYLLFYELIPGFKSMRVPQRWSHLAILGASLLIALMLAALLPKIKSKSHRWLLAGFISLLVVGELHQPQFSTPVPAPNGIYTVLSRLPAGVVLELPASTYPFPLTQIEVARLYQHTFLFSQEHRYVNGYSGFAAPDWSAKIYGLQSSPVSFSASLQAFNPDYVLVNTAEYDAMSQAIGSQLTSQQMLEIINHQTYKPIYTQNGEVLFVK